jgi:hypothetical protein
MFCECGERGAETGFAKDDRIETAGDAAQVVDRVPDFGLREVQVVLGGRRLATGAAASRARGR